MKPSRINKMKSAIFKILFLSLCIIANTHFAFAQTASILPPGYTQYLDSNGKPLSAGKVYNYIPSTTTLKTTWQDAAETIPNTNPVVLDAGGRAKILGDGSYRQIVKDRNGVTIWDAVTSSTGSGSTSPTATGDGDLVGTIKPWAGMTAPNQYAFTYGQEVSRTTYSALYKAITSSQATFCNSGSPVLNGLSDTTNFWIGMSVEVTCVAAGFSTIISKTASTVTLAANANITTNTNAIFYPWGRGNGTTTFNLPDLRGVVPVGNNNMGGVASSNLSSTYFGATNPNSIGALGGFQSTTLIAAYLPTHTHISSSLSDPGHLHSYSTFTNSNILAGGGFPVPNVVASSNTGTSFSNVTISPNTGGCPGCAQTPFNNIPPSRSTNYIIKITPDSNSATASGVTSLGGMTGDIACGTGLTCTGNIVSVTPSVPVTPAIYTPEQYGAACDGTTDDGVALQAAATAASNAAITGSVIFQVGQACATSTTVTLNAKDNIKVQFLAKGKINVIGSNASVSGFQVIGGGTTGAPTTITVNANYGTRDLTVASAAGISIGDTILINVALGYAPQPTYARGMINQVQNVVGNVLTLVQPLAWNIDATKTNSVQKITVAKNVEISGVKVDGSSYTGAGGIGFLYQYLSNSKISDTFTTNFNGTNGSGSYGYALWATTLRDVLDIGSGDTASNSIQLWYATNNRIENLRSYKSNGFGVVLLYVAGNTISDLVSEYSAGRGVKLYGSCDNMIDRVRGDYAQGTLVGFAISVGSCNNRVNHVQTLYNATSGLWFDGLDNSNNTIHDVKSFGNGTYDIWIAATAPFTDNNNKITGIDALAVNTLIDAGNTGDTLQYLPNANAGNFFRSDGAQTNTVSGVWSATNFISNGTGNYPSYNSVNIANFGGTAAGAAYIGDNIYWDEAGSTYRTNITNGAVGYALLRLGVGGLVQVATATGATTAGAAVVPAFVNLVKQGDVFDAIGFSGATSGTATISAQAVAGTPSLVLPTGSGTFAVSATSPLSLNTTTGALSCPTCNTSSATVTSITPGNGITSTLTATAPGSAITTSGTLSSAELINAQTGTTYAILDGDRAKLITGTNAAAQAYSIAQAGASSAFQAGWYVDIQNNSTNVAGKITVTPTTSTINGAATLKIQPGQFARIVSDGTNYQVYGLPSGAQLPGTTTNDNANTGNLGQYATAECNNLALTTATDINCSSFSLTAGDWDLSAVCYYVPAATTTVTLGTCSFNTVITAVNNALGSYARQYWSPNTFVPNTPITIIIPNYRASISGTTTYYLNANMTFGTSTAALYGIQRARRMR